MMTRRDMTAEQIQNTDLEGIIDLIHRLEDEIEDLEEMKAT